MSTPTVSAVVPVFNAERYIGESLAAILSQTRPADEVIVVDDGSTDDLDDALAPFRGEIRVVRQPNLGVAGAMNRCFEEARGDYVAKCDADDIWEREKLERQLESVSAHPEIDIAFAGAHFFGLSEGPRAPYAPAGVLCSRSFTRELYERGNFVCASSMLIRRRLFERLGPFALGLACEDYDYWLRALGAGAVIFHDPRTLVRYRAHAQQVSSQSALRICQADYMVHGWHAGLVEDARLVRKVQANDLSNIGRILRDQELPREARAMFAASLSRRATLRALGWVLVLSTPPRWRRSLADRLIAVKRVLRPAASR